MNLDFLSAFIIGLLGSGHCLVMCGGITTMLTSALPHKKQTQLGDISVTQSLSTSNAKLVFFYHIGRISTYVMLGSIVGFSGSIAAKNIGLPLAGLRVISAVFLILLGCYIGQWLTWLNKIEALGARLWRTLSPLTKKVIPVDSLDKALSLGVLWGWLPCGLVYSTLTWSLASGDGLTGAGIMFFFGLGTLPSLLTLSVGLVSINKLLSNPKLKQSIALLLITYGIYCFFVAYKLLF